MIGRKGEVVRKENEAKRGNVVGTNLTNQEKRVERKMVKNTDLSREVLNLN